VHFLLELSAIERRLPSEIAVSVVDMTASDDKASSVVPLKAPANLGEQAFNALFEFTTSIFGMDRVFLFCARQIPPHIPNLSKRNPLPGEQTSYFVNIMSQMRRTHFFNLLPHLLGILKYLRRDAGVESYALLAHFSSGNRSVLAQVIKRAKVVLEQANDPERKKTAAIEEKDAQQLSNLFTLMEYLLVHPVNADTFIKHGLQWTLAFRTKMDLVINRGQYNRGQSLRLIALVLQNASDNALKALQVRQQEYKKIQSLAVEMKTDLEQKKISGSGLKLNVFAHLVARNLGQEKKSNNDEDEHGLGNTIKRDLGDLINRSHLTFQDSATAQVWTSTLLTLLLANKGTRQNSRAFTFDAKQAQQLLARAQDFANLLLQQEPSSPTHMHYTQALVSSLSVLKILHENESTHFNVRHGQRRLALVCFNIIKEKMMPAEVQVKAAECVSTIDIKHLAVDELRDLIAHFCLMPAVSSNITYNIATRLMYLMFRVALYKVHDESDSSNNGRLFRLSYTSESMLAVYGAVNKALAADDINPFNPREHKLGSKGYNQFGFKYFQRACSKMLMTAWLINSLQFHTNDPENLLFKSLIMEQRILQNLRDRFVLLKRTRRCVQCEIALSVFNTQPKATGTTVLCSGCSSHPLKMTDYTMFFVQMEQTWIGHHLPFLVEALEKIKSNPRDAVSARVLWQIANTLEGKHTEMHLCKNDKTAEDHFLEWHNAEPGQSLDEAKNTESKKVERAATQKTVLLFECRCELDLPFVFGQT
jgi:hypothetical protein